MEKFPPSTKEDFTQTNEPPMEEKRQQWQKKLDELQTPDVYGYVIDKGVQETIAALQLLGFNTTQSDQGNYSETPWVQVEPEKPKDIYVGEHALKTELMTKAGISSDEIDEKSAVFNREKQVDIEESAREQLMKMGAEYTPEFQEWRGQSALLAQKLKNMVGEFYASEEAPKDSSDLSVGVEFPYRAPQYNTYIQDTPFLKVAFLKEKVNMDTLSEEERQSASARALREMVRFTEFMKEKFFEGA
jgi:hypothetical protein